MTTPRIYLCGRGLGHYRPLLDGLKNLVSDGVLPLRFDKNKKQFLFLSDLLPIKETLVGTNRHNKQRVNACNVIVGGVIAFDYIQDICKDILNNDAILARCKKNYIKYIDCNCPQLGYVCMYDEIIKDYVLQHNPELKDWLL